MRTRLRTVLALGLITAGGILLQPCAAEWLTIGKAEENTARLQVDNSELDRSLTAPSPGSFANVVEQASPAVVNVFSEKIVRSAEQRQQMPFFDDPFFRRFFGGPEMPDQWRPPDRREQSLGSGVIVSKDGYILTNSHVVDGADEVKVAMQGKREYKAKIIGADAKTDIAVLKIDAKDLPAVTLADSDLIKVGDLVFAIGNPFGLGKTVTMGIVSATERGVGIVDYEDFIQTDAAINPGNSGGALIDAKGRLIGINTAILSRSGGNQGIGFAVPVNLARRIMADVLDDGKVARGFLGVTIQDIDDDLRAAFDLNDSAGALVTSVGEGSAAEKAGIENGDVIVEFAGKPVRDVRNLRLAVAATPPETKIGVVVIREGTRKSLEVILDTLDAELVAGGVSNRGAGLLRGVTLQPAAGEDGLNVVAVDEDAPAARHLNPHDRIVEVNRHRVNQLADLRDAVAKSANSVLLYVKRKDQGRYVVIRE